MEKLKAEAKNELINHLLNVNINDETEAENEADTLYRWNLGNKAEKEMEAINKLAKSVEEDIFIEVFFEAWNEVINIVACYKEF